MNPEDNNIPNPEDVKTPPAQATQPPKEEKETVVVNKKSLDKLVQLVETQGKEIKKLTEIADKGRLAHYESQHKGESPRIYRVTQFDGRTITSWKMVTNQVWKDTEGKWREKQEIEVFYNDGGNQVLPYVEFVTKTAKAEAKLVSTETVGSKVYMELALESGEKVKLDSVFIN